MKPAVGVIGAGRMGASIIGHLVRKGFPTYACERWGTQTMAWAEDDMVIVGEMAAKAASRCRRRA